MIDFFSGLLTPIIAVLATYIALQQWRTNNLRLKYELFERRYELFEVITSFVANILARGRVEANSEMQFLRDTKTVIFLFDNRIHAFVQEIYCNAVRLYSLGAMEHTFVGDKLAHNVDEQRKIKDWFSEQLNTSAVRFAPFLSFGGHQSMNENQRRLLLWVTIAVCLLLAGITWVLGIASFHHIAANDGDVFDKVLYHNNLKWIVPLLTGLLGLLLIGLTGFVGFWFVLRDQLESRR